MTVNNPDYMTTVRYKWSCMVCLWCLMFCPADAAPGGGGADKSMAPGRERAAADKPARKDKSRQPVQDSACNNVPAHPFDLILGRPTTNAVTVSVLCYEDAGGYAWT